MKERRRTLRWSEQLGQVHGSKVIQVQWILGLLLELLGKRCFLSLRVATLVKHSCQEKTLAENKLHPHRGKLNQEMSTTLRTQFEQLDTAIPEASDLKLSGHVNK